MELNSSNQKRNNEEQVINHNKDNTNTNNINVINIINGKPEISVIANCINNNFENINNSAMKTANNMKEIIKKNFDRESSKQIKESTEKDVGTEEKVIPNVSENCKITPLQRFRKIIKLNLNVISKIT